jgi:hypothetical protein
MRLLPTMVPQAAASTYSIVHLEPLSDIQQHDDKRNTYTNVCPPRRCLKEESNIAANNGMSKPGAEDLFRFLKSSNPKLHGKHLQNDAEAPPPQTLLRMVVEGRLYASKRKGKYTSSRDLKKIKYRLLVFGGESNRNPARGLGDVMMTGAACKAAQVLQAA